MQRYPGNVYSMMRFFLNRSLDRPHSGSEPRLAWSIAPPPRRTTWYKLSEQQAPSPRWPTTHSHNQLVIYASRLYYCRVALRRSANIHTCAPARPHTPLRAQYHFLAIRLHRIVASNHMPRGYNGFLYGHYIKAAANQRIYCVQYIVNTERCTMYDVHCMTCTVRSTLYIMSYTVRRTLYVIHCTTHNVCHTSYVHVSCDVY